MRAVFLLAVAPLLLAACASSPTTERPAVERPESMRPEGVEPEGLHSMRSDLADQRSEARERVRTLDVRPNQMSAQSDTAWYDGVVGTAADMVHTALGWLWVF